MADRAVVTDGTDSFYASRLMFQSLYDHGDFEKITALSSSVAEAKKMLISRNTRYSGLIDVLTFSEESLAEGMAGANIWVAVNAKASAVAEQLAAAKAAGVTRAFIHLCSEDPDDASLDAAALQASLQASGLTFTVLRTGKLTAKGAGGALKIDEVDLPICGEVPADDIFRFITEALTMDDASGRAISLCPSADDSQLKEMRFAGCSRREEIEALLKGRITESIVEETAAEAEATAEEAAVSKAEDEASREDELKMLLARAKEKGIENQKRMKEEEEAKAALREERAMYFKQADDARTDGDDDEGGETPEEPPPPAEEKKKDDDDDDGLALA